MKNIVPVIATLLLLCGCGEKKSSEILVSFYPLQIFALNICEGIPDLTPSLMLPATLGCPHDYALTPNDVLQIETARALIMHGTLETFLSKETLRSLNPHLTIICADEKHTAIEADEHDDAHRRGNANPHTWVSPYRAAAETRVIANALVTLYPEHGKQIMENASRYIANLSALANEMKEAIAELPHKRIITFHTAFDYFARDLGLDIVGVIELEPNAMPSAKHLAELSALAKASDVTAIFADADSPTALAETIANETGLPLYTLNAATSGTRLTRDAYETIMRNNLAVLKEALK